MATRSVKPPARKYVGRILKRHEGKPVCALPGCGRPAAFHAQTYCSHTCWSNHRWLLTLDKAG